MERVLLIHMGLWGIEPQVGLARELLHAEANKNGYHDDIIDLYKINPDPKLNCKLKSGLFTKKCNFFRTG